MRQYLDALRHVRDNGVKKGESDRSCGCWPRHQGGGASSEAPQRPRQQRGHVQAPATGGDESYPLGDDAVDECHRGRRPDDTTPAPSAGEQRDGRDDQFRGGSAHLSAGRGLHRVEMGAQGIDRLSARIRTGRRARRVRPPGAGFFMVDCLLSR